ncbi:MAG TPA: Holliday junction resolvase RuvX [Verrucomicrobiae bacterium]|jgi:putative Holliday junction resolvase
MRVLGIDHGTKRVGLAISDEMAMIAQPLDYLDAQPTAKLLSSLCEIITQREVGEIVVGLPRNMDGSYGPAAAQVREFAAALQQVVTVPIKMWDERLTSTQANRVLIQGGVRREQRKLKVDQTAAAILLQSYLDRAGG